MRIIFYLLDWLFYYSFSVSFLHVLSWNLFRLIKTVIMLPHLYFSCVFTASDCSSDSAVIWWRQTNSQTCGRKAHLRWLVALQHRNEQNVTGLCYCCFNFPVDFTQRYLRTQTKAVGLREGMGSDWGKLDQDQRNKSLNAGSGRTRVSEDEEGRSHRH